MWLWIAVGVVVWLVLIVGAWVLMVAGHAERRAEAMRARESRRQWEGWDQ